MCYVLAPFTKLIGGPKIVLEEYTENRSLWNHRDTLFLFIIRLDDRDDLWKSNIKFTTPPRTLISILYIIFFYRFVGSFNKDTWLMLVMAAALAP